MTGAFDITALITSFGLLILAPIAIVEGPIVTVIAAWLASQGLLSLPSVFVVVVLADLVGDGLLYAVGRGLLGRLSPRWRVRLGLLPDKMAVLLDVFHTKGGRVLLAAKWTHAAGLPVLVAAGAARMPFARFLQFNLIGTIPKTLILLAIGYAFGSAHETIAGWISTGGLVLVGVVGLAGLIWFSWRKRRTSP